MTMRIIMLFPLVVVATVILILSYFRRFHGADKAETLSDMKKDKFEIVVTTFETYRDNVVCKNLKINN